MLNVDMRRRANPYNRRNHPQISRGVDIKDFATRRPSLQEMMMDAGDHLSGWTEPFHPTNYQNEMLRYADVQGRYNSWGNFTANARSRWSRRQTMHRLHQDEELIHLINHTRPRI